MLAMAQRIVILGGGTGGTLLANRLRRRLDRATEIVVVDRDDRHVYQPGLLFVPFGLERPDRIVRSRAQQLHDGIEFREAEIDRLDADSSTVCLRDGSTLDYDVCVIATGADLLPEETDGLTGPGWGESIFSFYTLDGATALRDRLQMFTGGRLVVNVVDMPIKCPVAALEFAFLADWHLTRLGVRGDVEITYATPLDAAFTKPVAADHLAGMLERKGIRLQAEFATGRVDSERGRLVSWDEREIPFDLLVAVPLHGGAGFVARSPGLGDELGFVETDLHTLQSRRAPNVFAIGDATNLPTSKAGSATHFEAEALSENIAALLAGEPLQGSYDGHVNCFIESGFHKAMLIDFNYEQEPVPGRFPEPHVGPLPLLRESRLNHLAKLAFEPLYWNVLLPGHGVPGLGSDLDLAGKQLAPTHQGGAR
jgi:sulfide:quinone oxidoreductase